MPPPSLRMSGLAGSRQGSPRDFDVTSLKGLASCHWLSRYWLHNIIRLGRFSHRPTAAAPVVVEVAEGNVMWWGVRHRVPGLRTANDLFTVNEGGGGVSQSAFNKCGIGLGSVTGKCTVGQCPLKVTILNEFPTNESMPSPSAAESWDRGPRLAASQQYRRLGMGRHRLSEMPRFYFADRGHAGMGPIGAAAG